MTIETAGTNEPATSTAPDAEPEDQVRGHTYSLLGHLLAAPPDQQTLDLLISIDPGPDTEGTLLGAAWQMLQTAATRTDVQQLDDEYHELFIGIGRGELIPYGSWYVTGFLMEQPLATLRADLERMGFARQEGVHEPEDHAAALCEVMSICAAGADAIPLEQQAAFFARHMGPWIGRFFRDMQSARSARFYRAVGQLGEQFIDIETQAFRMAAPGAMETVRPIRMVGRESRSTETRFEQEGQ
jgi:TorA maturation chaperone TorD